MSVVVNIFVVYIEAFLVIKFYLKSMSDLEIFVVMCVGMVSVVGFVLVGYVSMGIFLFYLIVVLFMFVFGGLLFVKIIYL